MKTTLRLLISITLAAWIGVHNPISSKAVGTEGFITGTISDQQSGLPVAGISVDFSGFSDGSGGGHVQTDLQGQYQISLSEGEYRISFYDGAGIYLSEWYDNASSYAGATPVQVISGQTTVADAQLEKAGIISGSIILDAPMPLYSSLEIDAYNVLSPTSMPEWAMFYGPGTGPYRIGRLPTGTYKIKSLYVVPNSYVQDYAIAYYDLKLTFTEASNVNVIAGATTSLDIDLTQLGQICGTITDFFTLQPVPQLFEVIALNNGETVAAAYTDTSGHYCLSHLVPGNYSVVFTGYVWPGNCIKFCSTGHPYQEQQFPTVIALERGQTVSGIDAIVAPYMIFMPLLIK